MMKQFRVEYASGGRLYLGRNVYKHYFTCNDKGKIIKHHKSTWIKFIKWLEFK